MNEIALDLDLHNELEFKVSVEGTKPAEASCRLMFENSGFNDVKINENVDFEQLYKMKKSQ